jgi:hypothetical protein
MEMLIVICLVTITLMVWLIVGGESDDEVVPPSTPVPDFESMTKVQLIEYADANNIPVKKSWSKQRILLNVMDPTLFSKD